MVILFLVLIIIISFVLGFIVLVQNPKGGGLAGNIAGFSNQFMGVKQTTDILEKGTWLFAAALGVACLISSFFISGSSAVEDKTKNIGNPTQTAPAPTQNNSPGTSTASKIDFCKRLLTDPVNRQGFLLFCCLHLRSGRCFMYQWHRFFTVQLIL
jgi:preprotein translocase subunit SecG